MDEGAQTEEIGLQFLKRGKNRTFMTFEEFMAQENRYSE
jgi:hypothetical protein